MSTFQSSTQLCNPSNGEIPLTLTSIVSIADSSLLSSSGDVHLNNGNASIQSSTRQRRSTRIIPMSDVSHRLNKRKILHNRRCIVSNYMCYFGLIGVVLMVIENELSFQYINYQYTFLSFFIKTLITITTAILVFLVIYYNRLSLIRYPLSSSLGSWRVELTVRRIVLILLEIFICSIHPFPRHFPFISTKQSSTSSRLEVDLILGLPSIIFVIIKKLSYCFYIVFARLYLLCRFIIHRSHLAHNASSQSIGYFNEVAINFMFLIKTYLERWPGRCLLSVSLLVFFIGSWSLRACNYKSMTDRLSLLDSMWLFIVTFTTVGYGDITPSTYCGRSIASIIALLGILSTALLISVIAHKLELSRSEKYVHHFVLQIALEKERRNQAANVIKSALRVWYLKRKRQPTSFAYVRAQRKLAQSIHLNHQFKHEQKQLIDSCVGFPEMITLQRDSNDKIQENMQRSLVMEKKVEEIECTLVEMSRTMMNIQNRLDSLLNKQLS